MKEIFMSASAIASIILCFVGIVKMPFKNNLKVKHPTLYRFIFCFLSLALAGTLPILAQVYIINGALKSIDFVILEVATIGMVFVSYGAYEGLGIKKLFHIMFAKIKELCNKYSDNKLEKVISKVGIERLTELAKLMEEKKVVEENKEENKTDEPQNIA